MKTLGLLAICLAFLAAGVGMAAEADMSRVFQRVSAATPPAVNAVAGARAVVAAPAAGPIVVDGALSEVAWQKAAEAGDFVLFGAAAKAPLRTSVRVLRDAEALYVGFSCEETAPDQMKAAADLKPDQDQVWQDDCVEVFLDPRGEGKECYHLIVSAGGGRYDARIAQPTPAQIQEDSGWNGDWQAAVRRESRGWTAEIRVPFKALSADPPGPGRRWKAQFARSRQPEPRAVYSWTTVPDKRLASAEHFGLLRFDGGPVSLTELLVETAGLGRNEARFLARNASGDPIPVKALLQVFHGDKSVAESGAEVALPAGREAGGRLVYDLKALDGALRGRFTLRRANTDDALADVEFNPGAPDAPVHLRFDGAQLAAEVGLGLVSLREGGWEGRLTLRDAAGRELAARTEPLATTRLKWLVDLGAFPRQVVTVGLAVAKAGQPPVAKGEVEHLAFLEPYASVIRSPAGPDVAPPAALAAAPIRVGLPPERTALAGMSFPVQCGVPIPRGELRAPGLARLRDRHGRLVPVQTRTLGLWDPPGSPDSSIRWLLAEFDARVEEDADPAYTLEYGTEVAAPAEARDAVRVQSDEGGYTVDTGSLRLRVGRRRFGLFDQVWLDGRPMLREDGPRGPYLVDQDGVTYRAALDPSPEVFIEENGPRVVTILARGFYVSDRGERLNQWIVRLRAFAGRPEARLYHTFVVTEDSATKRFRDIGIQWPLAADGPRNVAFARGGAYRTTEPEERIASDPQNDWIRLEAADAARYASVFLHQDTHKRFAVWGDDQPLAEGERCGHVFDLRGNRSGMAVAVRWMWQSYPMGFEWLRDGEARVHLWTMRGQGELDFRARPWLERRGCWDIWAKQILDVKDRRHEYPAELGGTMVATGVGVSRTHEVLLTWYAVKSGATTTPFERTAYTLQKPVFAFADPAWLRRTEALGRLHPFDPERFEAVERTLATYQDAFHRDLWEDRSHDARYPDNYGCFDFGDTLHQPKYAHRYWSHMFYVEPSVFWVLFVRSGDRRFLEFAEAGSRHHMDVDTCHFGDSEHVRPGAFCNDDSGIFHWGNYGSTVITTSNYLPYLTLCYYLTGYGRAGDVALEVGDMVKASLARRGNPGWAHRASGQGLWAAVELYRLTWDEAFRKLADHIAGQVVANVRDGLCTGYDGSTPADFTHAYIFPGTIAYHQLTRDPAIAEWIVRQVNYVGRHKLHAFHGVYFAQWDGPAYVYHLTGDAKVLGVPRWNLGVISRHAPEDVAPFVGNRVWWMFKAGYLMDALAAAGPEGARWADFAPPESTAGEIQVLDSEDTAFQLDVRLGLAAVSDPKAQERMGDLKAEVEAGGPFLALIGPDGREIARRPYPSAPRIDPWFHINGWTETFTVKSDGLKGVYRLRVLTRKGLLFQMWLTNNTLGKAMFSAGTGDGISPSFRYAPAKRYWFHVPQGVERFRFEFLVPQYLADMPVQVFDPDGNKAADVNLARTPPEKRKDWIPVEVACPPGSQGRPWSVTLGSCGETRFFRLQGVPAFFGESAESSFPPAP